MQITDYHLNKNPLPETLSESIWKYLSIEQRSSIWQHSCSWIVEYKELDFVMRSIPRSVLYLEAVHRCPKPMEVFAEELFHRKTSGVGELYAIAISLNGSVAISRIE